MSAKKPAKREVANVPKKMEPARIGVGGSVATEWNTMLANQTVNTLLEPEMRRPYEERDSVPVARDAERTMPDPRGKVSRRSGR